MQDSSNGSLILGPNKFQHGRSIYICKSKPCIEKAKTNKRYKNYQEIFQKLKV